MGSGGKNTPISICNRLLSLFTSDQFHVNKFIISSSFTYNITFYLELKHIIMICYYFFVHKFTVVELSIVLVICLYYYVHEYRMSPKSLYIHYKNSIINKYLTFCLVKWYLIFNLNNILWLPMFKEISLKNAFYASMFANFVEII